MSKKIARKLYFFLKPYFKRIVCTVGIRKILEPWHPKIQAWLGINQYVLLTSETSRYQSENAPPLQAYLLSKSNDQITVHIVTDSINLGSLFGGVGTALIFSVLLANKLNARLCIITRTEPPNPKGFNLLLSLYKLTPVNEVTFKYLHIFDENNQVGFSEDDFFVTTSWWTTASTLKNIPSKNILYILQEDERMFYAFGDERLKCDAILRNVEIQFIVNSKLLFDHFVNDGFENIVACGMWFEPAFSKTVFYPRTKNKKNKRKFFFYARPNHSRNLFFFGASIINRAIVENVIDLNEWDIVFVGNHLPVIIFDNGYKPECLENLSWKVYVELLGTVDLGLALMYTPHPSYPPLDLAASGAVVVTNRYGNKQSLGSYSANIILSDLTEQAFIVSLKEAVDLVKNQNKRIQNYQNNQFLDSWECSFSMILEKISMLRRDVC